MQPSWRMSKSARLAVSKTTVGLQPKTRALLKDVTNVCDDTLYMDCKNATKNQVRTSNFFLFYCYVQSENFQCTKYYMLTTFILD